MSGSALRRAIQSRSILGLLSLTRAPAFPGALPIRAPHFETCSGTSGFNSLSNAADSVAVVPCTRLQVIQPPAGLVGFPIERGTQVRRAITRSSSRSRVLTSAEDAGETFRPERPIVIEPLQRPVVV